MRVVIREQRVVADQQRRVGTRQHGVRSGAMRHERRRDLESGAHSIRSSATDVRELVSSAIVPDSRIGAA